MNVGDQVLIFNREKKSYEIGQVLLKYKRNKIRRYDVLLERGVRMDFLSTDPNNSFFIDEEKTLKFSK